MILSKKLRKIRSLELQSSKDFSKIYDSLISLKNYSEKEFK